MHPNLLVSSLPPLALAPPRIDAAVKHMPPSVAPPKSRAVPPPSPRRAAALDRGVLKGCFYGVPLSTLIWGGLLYLYFG